MAGGGSSSDEAVTRAAGLYTSPNQLSYVPSGALREALNTVINYPGKVESRRGFERLWKFGSPTSRGNALMSYRGTLLVQYDADKLTYNNGAGFTDYAGSYAPPSSALRTKFAETDLNFFFTSASGVKMTDDVTSEPRDVGLPKGPAASSNAALSSTARVSSTAFTGNPGDGWMPGDSQTSYLVVVGTRDANDNIKLGEGGDPFFIANPPDASLAIGDLTSVLASSHVVVTIHNLANAGLYQAGDVVQLAPSTIDGNFTGGNKTIVGADTATSLEYIDNTSVAGHTSSATATLTTAFRNIQVSIPIPPYLTTEQFIRVYRSKASTGASVVPNPDYFLDNEIALTSGIIAAGVYSYTDSTPDEALGDSYYNNQNVGGEAVDGSPTNENARPPLCSDLTSFDHRLWGANLQERQNLTATLLGTTETPVFGPPGNGLQRGDTVTVGGVTFTAQRAGLLPTAPNTFFLFDLTFNPALTQAQCVQYTSQSLAVAINQNATCTVTASYIPSALLGQLFFEARAPNASLFTFATSRPTAWNPDPTGGLTSSGQAATNGLWFAKQDQPEAVPRLNRLSVGERNHNVLRVKALGSYLYVFTDRGIYTISGTYPYRVDLVSKTSILVAPDSLVDFDDALYALTTQGITRVSAAGINVLSTPIEQSLKSLYGVELPVLKTATAAVGYESYRKYIISLPTVAGDTVNTQQFLYDVATQTFTRWDRPANSFYIVPETDTLYMLRTDENSVSFERRSQDDTDYSDESFATTITGISADRLTLTLTNTLQLKQGDLVYQGSTAQALVDTIDTVAGTVTLREMAPDWALGTATVYPAITSRAIWSEIFAGKPNWLKHFPAVTFHFYTPGISFGQAIFISDLGPSEEMVPLGLGGWGDPRWGQFAFGQPTSIKNQRVFVTRNVPRATFLNVGVQVQEARGVWSLLGYSAEEQPMSERNSK